MRVAAWLRLSWAPNDRERNSRDPGERARVQGAVYGSGTRVTSEQASAAAALRWRGGAPRALSAE
eukprot:9484030-Pyramimonas_sp.AAC.1